MKRPVLVTIIGWLIVIEGTFALAGITFALSMHVYHPGPSVALGYLTNAAVVIVGFGILRGDQWARIVYVAGMTAVRAVQFYPLQFNYGFLLWGGFLLASAVILFLPRSNAYFSRLESSAAIR